MDNNIPLINDLINTFPDFEVNNYFDKSIIQIHNDFINTNYQTYTNKQIYDYIKFRRA